jgi:CMP/dCMP kinase
MILSTGYVIAIDGPVASGKGTIAPLLAQRLHGFYLYSGAVFRCIGLYCLQHQINTKDEYAVNEVLPLIHIELKQLNVVLNGKDVTEQIRDQKIAMAASNVGIFREVRATMARIMRETAKAVTENNMPVITEGRDMGTSVFPDAAIKIFLTANTEVRAARRFEQIKQKDQSTKETLDHVLTDTIARDKQDSARKIDPLVREPEKYNYFVIDNSHMKEEETIDTILEKINQTI